MPNLALLIEPTLTIPNIASYAETTIRNDGVGKLYRFLYVSFVGFLRMNTPSTHASSMYASR
jgi:hypothetical protein